MASERLECPNCGAMFRSGRLACPECGSDAETGWRDAQDLDYLSVDIPDSYEELIAGSTRPRRKVFTIAAVLALIAMLCFALFR